MLKLRDVDTGDRCDGYTDRTEELPCGVGVGAVLVVENTKRGVSGTMQCYVKFTPGSRVTVEVPSVSTVGPFRRVVPPPIQSRTVRLVDIADAAGRGAGCVDNRLWEFRARVVNLNVLSIKWGCKFCGSDAGSMGAANAAAAESSMAGSRGPDDVEGIGAVLAGCGRCRPKGVSSRAAAAAAERSCGFEVECNATLDDAGLPMSKVEGAPLVAAVGHAKSMGEMRITASLSYKRWTDAEDKRATDFFGPQSHPGPNASSLNLNGKPTGVMYAPIPKVRAVAVTPVECAREAAAALDSLERRRR